MELLPLAKLKILRDDYLFVVNIANPSHYLYGRVKSRSLGYCELDLIGLEGRRAIYFDAWVGIVVELPTLVLKLKPKNRELPL